jgi:hypothetical protein
MFALFKGLRMRAKKVRSGHPNTKRTKKSHLLNFLHRVVVMMATELDDLVFGKFVLVGYFDADKIKGILHPP